jgi:hypothetical protein
MSLKTQKGALHAVLNALISGLNQLRDASVGTNIHADTTSCTVPDVQNPVASALQVTAATATNTATAIVMLNEIKGVQNIHVMDPLAHKSAVSAAITVDDATNLATGITLGVAARAAHTTHLSESNVHYTADTVNVATYTATPTTEANLVTLANDLTVQTNAHITSALPGSHIEQI